MIILIHLNYTDKNSAQVRYEKKKIVKISSHMTADVHVT